MSGHRYGELKHVPISPAMHEYLARCVSPKDPVLESLITSTYQVCGDWAVMAIPVEQAALLTMLTRLLGARTVVDIGTFTGVSALAFANGLAPGGTVMTCDVTDEWVTKIGREHWKRAGVADRIEFRLGPAADTLAALPAGTVIDLAFLDADKENCEIYLDLIMRSLRPGGLVIVDNILDRGYVLDPDLPADERWRDRAALVHAFNRVLTADGRLETVALPISDGLVIARKKCES